MSQFSMSAFEPVNRRSMGCPDMLMTISAPSALASGRLFEYWPSAPAPRSLSTVSVGDAMKPSGESPALDGAITSLASARASASAIWLRQELPMHTKRTFTGGIGYDPLRASFRKYSCTVVSDVSSG